MKKRLIGIALIAVVLMIMFSACEQTVVFPTASRPSDVTASLLNAAYVKVTWKAAEDASSYNIYYQKDGTKTISKSNSYGTNSYTYLADGNSSYTSVPNLDPDSWSALLSIGYASSGAGSLSNGSFKIGVQAESPYPNKAASDIEWSENLVFVSFRP